MNQLMRYLFYRLKKHAEIAIYAMEKGIAVASKIGRKYSLKNCFNRVKTQERTCTPYMLLENCCWSASELLTLNMARNGLLALSYII